MCTKGSSGGTGASSVWMRTELWSFPVRRSMRRGSSSRLSVPAGQPRGQSIRERRRERRRPENGVGEPRFFTPFGGKVGRDMCASSSGRSPVLLCWAPIDRRPSEECCDGDSWKVGRRVVTAFVRAGLT